MDEIENMIPWERHIHIDFIRAQVAQQREFEREMALRS